MASAALLWVPVAAEHKESEVRLRHGDRGPDVASYQGFPDWPEVAAWGARFAFTKVTEGAAYLNPYFADNWREIKAVGLLRGGYHFARPDEGSPDREVDWLLSKVRLEGDDLLALDLEVGSGNLHDWCMAWLLGFTLKTGRKALLYSGSYFMRDHGLDAPDIAAACGGLWLASYTPDKPAVPRGFPEIMFWQYTDAAQITGIQGGVDCSVYLL